MLSLYQKGVHIEKFWFLGSAHLVGSLPKIHYTRIAFFLSSFSLNIHPSLIHYVFLQNLSWTPAFTGCIVLIRKLGTLNDNIKTCIYIYI